MEKQTQNLPTVAELFSDNIETAFQNEKLNMLLNQEPKKEWIKEHPFIAGYRYIPIDKIEFMLRKIFKKYRIEITNQGTAFNGVWVTVRVHYLNPVTGEMDFHDGIGAKQLQTKKGTSPADLANVNQGAIEMAFPIAKTVAVKDACDHFGKLFGCDINRKDTMAFTVDSNLDKSIAQEVDQQIQDQLDLMTDLQQLDSYVFQLTSADKKLNRDTAFRNAVEKTKQRLKPKN